MRPETAERLRPCGLATRLRPTPAPSAQPQTPDLPATIATGPPNNFGLALAPFSLESRCRRSWRSNRSTWLPVSAMSIPSSVRTSDDGDTRRHLDASAPSAEPPSESPASVCTLEYCSFGCQPMSAAKS
eukprot:scaffold155351_cov31-Tisochrysis_lutea.AAC.10